MKKPRLGKICNCGDHAWTSSTKGFTIFVSPEDIYLLNEFVWTAKVTARNAYATRYKRNPQKKLYGLYIHHSILSRTQDEEIDHINRNGMDNRRNNLRAVTPQLNKLNAKKEAGASSKFKGVYKKRDRNKWVASLKIDGAVKYLGSFENEIDAARHVQSIAHTIHGDNWRP